MKKYRDIEFRGKCIHTNELIYGSLITHDSPAGIAYYIFYVDNALTSPFMYRVAPDSIQQFTGFYDKENSKIYEGDSLHEICNFDGDILEGIYPVLWNDETMCFCIDESHEKDGKNSLALCPLNELELNEYTVIKEKQ